MGTWHSGALIMECLARLPMETLLILDEAYIEFAPDDTAVQVAIDDPRIIRMRTFSKGYGLAGARVGYALGAQDLIGKFEKIRNHFGMNRAAQSAAEAELNDQAWLLSVRDKVEASKQEIARIADENGLSTVESATNFMAIDCGRDGVFAQAVLAHLVQAGLLVRMPFVATQNRCISVSAGRSEDMDLLRRALPKAFAAAASVG